nr:uncharacterized protein LOC112023433 [Quercus suber]
MSCFKLPDTLCNELNSMISNFWWGQKDKERKMAWISWKKLCTPKDRGGMGFRDLKAFNMALLAKQGWRIQKDQSSLVHRIFKAKYFKKTSFMEAQLGRRPSYAWRCIMAAREIVARGSKWSIGNGEQVRIWTDRWLPTTRSFKAVSPRPPHAESELVASLIDMDRRGWDVTKVRNTFMPQEAQVILGIPISPRLPQDSLIWAWTPTGRFTVNSAYKVA